MKRSIKFLLHTKSRKTVSYFVILLNLQHNRRNCLIEDERNIMYFCLAKELAKIKEESEEDTCLDENNLQCGQSNWPHIRFINLTNQITIFIYRIIYTYIYHPINSSI